MKLSAYTKLKAHISLAIALIVVALVLSPLVWAAMTSLRPLTEITTASPTLLPQNITFDAYRDLWQEAPFAHYCANSVIVAASTTLLALGFSLTAAYAFARFNFKGGRILIVLVVMSQMLPGSSILIPIFRLVRTLGLIDTRTGLILIHTGFAIPFCVWLLVGYLRSIPRELDEAALIDGCSHLQLMYRILLPVIAPAVIAVGTFGFLLSWNEFLFAYVLGRDEAVTLPVALRNTFLTQYVNKYDQLFAASLIFSVPPIAIFAAMQRYFVRGLTMGAVKE
ncbi:MAG: carbohydrate ABC transporter permease [bacterium]